MDLLISLTEATLDNKKPILDNIERDRDCINDNEYQEVLNLYLDSEDERIGLGMSPGPKNYKG